MPPGTLKVMRGRPKPFSFRPHGIRRPQDFRRVYDRRSASNGGLIIYACENGLPFLRLGLSVSRKFGSAPERNRLRRLYREAFRLTRADLPTGLDIVFVPRGNECPTLEDLKQSLRLLIAQVAGRLAREAAKPKPAGHDQAP